MVTKYNVSIDSETDFKLNKLAEIVGESRASVVKNLIFHASQKEKEFIKLFRIIKLARLGLKPPMHPRTPNQ